MNESSGGVVDVVVWTVEVRQGQWLRKQKLQYRNEGIDPRLR